MGKKSSRKAQTRAKREEQKKTMKFPGIPGMKEDIQPIPLEEVNKEEFQQFIILCKDPETDEDLRLLCPRSLIRLAEDLHTTIEKYGPKFMEQQIKVVRLLPANQEGTHVVEMPIAAGTPEEVKAQINEKIAPPQEVEMALQRQAGLLFEVSGLKAISYVYICQGAGIGGAVVVNPNNPITNGEGAQLFEAIRGQADEFKRNAEAKGFNINDTEIIIPSAGEKNKFGK